MRPRTLLSLVLFLASAQAVSAQADGCRGALDALNRVKEQIVPSLSPDSPGGKDRLMQMSSTLARASANCNDASEIWFYREELARRLGQQKDASYYQSKISDLEFEHHYDPFSLPPAATPPTPVPNPKSNFVDTGSSPVRKKWALVVGIDQFQDQRIGHLKFAVKDSQDFVNFLDDPQGGNFDPSHVIHLENQNATLKGIKKALGELRLKAKPNDLVVIYLTSHGSPRQSDPNGMSYVMVNDTDIQDAATVYGTSLQMIDLVQIVNREIDARNVILILDTCYSGGALASFSQAPEAGSRGIKILPTDVPPDAPAATAFSQSFNNLKVGYGRAVITASRADEPSWESPQIQNGYFTHYLIQVFREGHGKDKLDSVFPRVKTSVATHVQQEQHAAQNPTYQFSEHADQIVLGESESN